MSEEFYVPGDVEYGQEIVIGGDVYVIGRSGADAINDLLAATRRHCRVPSNATPSLHMNTLEGPVTLVPFSDIFDALCAAE